jgi:hypothetical protein
MSVLSAARPASVLGRPVPAVPPELAPEPSAYALVHGLQGGQWWRTVLRKVSYLLPDEGVLQRTAQAPIATAHAPHDPLPEWLGAQAGRKGSMKTVPEPRAFQTGTDVIVRAHAASGEPVREMLAGAVIGRHAHKLRVFGERRSVWRDGRVHFTEPSLFERVPLRYELAYGGFDPVALREAMAAVQRRMGDEVAWRRSRAFLHDTLPQTVPVAYARNPIGMGYVADATPEALHGIALPRIELDHDRLTPERFAQGNGFDWLSRPVPAGFDFMDLRMFPRTALLGLPPLGFVAGTRDCAEVRWGQLPADFSRGNIMTVDEAEPLGAVHPDAARCAPIGLRLPMLGGDEPLNLVGLRADRPRWDVRLPGERPVFEVPGQGGLPGRLFQLFVDVEARRVELLWAASWKAGRELHPAEDRELLRHIGTRVERVR